MNHCSFFTALEDAQWVFIQGLTHTSIPRVSLEVEPSLAGMGVLVQPWVVTLSWWSALRALVILTRCGHPTASLGSLGHFQGWKCNFSIKNMGYCTSCHEFPSVTLRYWKGNFKGWKTNYQECSYMLLSVVKLLLIQCNRGHERDEGVTSLPNLQPCPAAGSLWLPRSEVCGSRRRAQKWAETPLFHCTFVGWEQWEMGCAGVFPAPLVCVECWSTVLLLGWVSQTAANLGWLLVLLLGGRGRGQQGQHLMCQTLLLPPERGEGWMHQPWRALQPTGGTTVPSLHPKSKGICHPDPKIESFLELLFQPCSLPSSGLAQEALSLLFSISKYQNIPDLSVIMSWERAGLQAQPLAQGPEHPRRY